MNDPDRQRAEERAARSDPEWRAAMEDKDTVKVSIPGVGALEGRGTIVLSVMLVAVACFAILYALKMHDEGTKERASTIIGALKNNSTEVLNLAQRMEEVGYILTLTDEQRKGLNLSMPDSLRQKVRR